MRRRFDRALFGPLEKEFLNSRTCEHDVHRYSGFAMDYGQDTRTFDEDLDIVDTHLEPQDL